MDENEISLAKILEKLDLAESLFKEGRTTPEVCSELSTDEDVLYEWLDRCSTPPNAVETLDSCPLTHAIVPFFTMNPKSKRKEQLGSGVALALDEEVFVLTAGHVADQVRSTSMYLPTNDGFMRLNEALITNIAPLSRTRENDDADIAFVYLPPEDTPHLSSLVKPLGVSDLLLSDALETGELFTFAGYPARRRNPKLEILDTMLNTYSGHAFANDMYRRLGYHRTSNILIRMRLKNLRGTNPAVGPGAKPYGISGGAVFAWPITFLDRVSAPVLKLAGIAHTYHPADNCMAATRVIPYLIFVLLKHPYLSAIVQKEASPAGIGEMFVRMVEDIRAGLP